MKKFVFISIALITVYGNLSAQNPAGEALSFDGVDDIVNVADSTSLDISNGHYNGGMDISHSHRSG